MMQFLLISVFLWDSFICFRRRYSISLPHVIHINNRWLFLCICRSIVFSLNLLLRCVFFILLLLTIDGSKARSHSILKDDLNRTNVAKQHRNENSSNFVLIFSLRLWRRCRWRLLAFEPLTHSLARSVSSVYKCTILFVRTYTHVFVYLFEMNIQSEHSFNFSHTKDTLAHDDRMSIENLCLFCLLNAQFSCSPLPLFLSGSLAGCSFTIFQNKRNSGVYGRAGAHTNMNKSISMQNRAHTRTYFTRNIFITWRTTHFTVFYSVHYNV